MPSTRLPRLISAGLVLLAVLRVATVWDDLPEAMASHFGASGKPDAFTSPLSFFVLFGIMGGGVVLLLHSLPWLLRRMPSSSINIPNREYWLVPERRDEALARLGVWLNWFACWLTVFLVITLELVLQANLRRGPLANGPFLLALGTFMTATLVLLVQLTRQFRLPRGG